MKSKIKTLGPSPPGHSGDSCTTVVHQCVVCTHWWSIHALGCSVSRSASRISSHLN